MGLQKVPVRGGELRGSKSKLPGQTAVHSFPRFPASMPQRRFCGLSRRASPNGVAKRKHVPGRSNGAVSEGAHLSPPVVLWVGVSSGPRSVRLAFRSIGASTCEGSLLSSWISAQHGTWCGSWRGCACALVGGGRLPAHGSARVHRPGGWGSAARAGAGTFALGEPAVRCSRSSAIGATWYCLPV